MTHRRCNHGAAQFRLLIVHVCAEPSKFRGGCPAEGYCNGCVEDDSPIPPDLGQADRRTMLRRRAQVGESLKAAREQRCYTRAAMAALAGVPVPRIESIEYGSSFPMKREGRKLRAALRIGRPASAGARR